jgi:hypothetical protein
MKNYWNRPLTKKEWLEFLEKACDEFDKCIVKYCMNQKHEGQFVGELCSPCHEFVTTGNGVYSQAYRNTQHEWVGLTNEEIDKIRNTLTLTNFGIYTYARAIEAKLKEKNT